jgi:hypothetical protein
VYFVVLLPLSFSTSVHGIYFGTPYHVFEKNGKKEVKKVERKKDIAREHSDAS